MDENLPKSQDEALDDRMRRFREWFRLDKKHTDEWRREATEDFKFLAGEQWSPEDVRTLKEQMRPVVTFNRTNPIINSISGMEIGNRQEVKYIPREQGDSQANELLTKAAEWYRDQSNADDEDSDMFLDSAVCGLGATETTLDFEEEEEGAPSINAINPLECYWDHSARKKNFTDSNRRWRVREKPLSDVLEMFDAEISAGLITRDDLDASWAKYGVAGDKPQDRTPGEQYNGDGKEAETAPGKDERLVTIAQLQYKKRVTVYDVFDPATGQKAEVPEEKFAVLSERAAMMGMPVQAQPRRKTVIMNVFLGGKVLRETPALCPTGFSIQFTTFYLERHTGRPYGMMRLMKDPQRWANKWMSQAMHILNTNAKGGLMVEEDAVDDIRDFERTWSRPDKITKVNNGALKDGRIQPKHQPSMDGSFFNLMQFAISAVPDVTGVNIEQLGLRNADQPASLEMMRKQAGAMNLAPVFDNLRRYRRDQGKVMLYIIQNYLSDGRLVRIVGDEGAQYVPLMMSADSKYDIIVDDQINTPDQKMQIWQMMVPFIQTMPPAVLLAMLDFSPFPPSVVEKIRKAAQAAGPSPEQQQIAQQGAQIEMRKNASDAAKNETQAALNTAKAEQITAENALGAIMARLGIAPLPLGAAPSAASGSNLIA